MSTPTPSASPPNTFVGWLLVAFGGLMALLCGSCTLGFWGVGIYAFASEPSPQSGSALLMLLVYVALLGGLPAAAGGFVFWTGWKMVRRPRGAGG